MEKTFILRSEEDTIGFGAAVGLLLPRGAFVAMYGGLGAGKTTMVRGIASFIGRGPQRHYESNLYYSKGTYH